MTLQSITANDFERVIYDQGEPCLVIFSRKTCHVCETVVPILEEMQPDYEGKFGFYYVDVEEQKSLFQRFSLKGVPQILFFNGGEYQGKLAGAVDDERVSEMIMNVLEA